MRKPLSQEDFMKLWDEVKDFIDSKIGFGDEGESRVDFKLIDRATHQSMPFLPQPYFSHIINVNPQEALIQDRKCLEVAMLNANIANGFLRTTWDIWHCSEQDLKDKK